ncbi:MAG TPA: LLM class flavin-dependent oxidoreductase [Longimicrobiaceae bacterium]|nr:LLM class flavin-dependent oxidoreductase [Longimicrobiaceae bacterium]
MIIRTPGRRIDVFTISPRTLDPREYWRNIEKVVDWSERYGCTGVLIFTGNDTFVDPWLVAQTVCIRTASLSPLVAVNPVYMHPFTAAKMISSLAYLYGRRVFLNMVTGTALSYQEALDDHLSHDERYDRLLEYLQVIDSLLRGEGLTTYGGRYYRVTDLQLSLPFPASLLPGVLLAGQSEAARRVCRAAGATGMQMLPAEREEGVNGAGGVHFGIVTRPTGDEAWEAARSLFPESPEDQEILEFSMENTDAVWKRRMWLASRDPELVSTGYWLAPFRNFKADCPYFVGDYERVAGLVARLVDRGVECFILDLPAREEEFRHVSAAFGMAAEQLGGVPAGVEA